MRGTVRSVDGRGRSCIESDGQTMAVSTRRHREHALQLLESPSCATPTTSCPKARSSCIATRGSWPVLVLIVITDLAAFGLGVMAQTTWDRTAKNILFGVIGSI